jgi:hypothetical protein
LTWTLIETTWADQHAPLWVRRKAGRRLFLSPDCLMLFHRQQVDDAQVTQQTLQCIVVMVRR